MNEQKKPTKVTLKGETTEAPKPEPAKIRTGVSAGTWQWQWTWGH